MKRKTKWTLSLQGRTSSYRTRLLLGFFLLVFVVMSVLSSIYYVNLKNAMERNLINANVSTINQIRNATEETVTNMRYSCLQLAYDSTVEIFMSLYDQRDRYIIEVIEFLDELHSKITYNKAIASSFIYYEASQKVIDVSLGRILDKGRMTSFGYDRVYLESNCYLIDQVVRNLGREDSSVSGIRVANLPLGDSNVVTFYKPVGPVRSGANIVLFVTMNGEYFDDLLNSIESGGAATIFIADENNTVVAAGGSLTSISPHDMETVARSTDGASAGELTRTIGGERYLVSFVESKTVPWKYFYFLPTRVVSSSLRPMRMHLLLILGGCLAAGLLASLAVALGLYRPIRKLVGTLNAYDLAQSSPVDELGYLANSFNKLLSENHDMEETIRDSIPVIRNAILANILRKKSAIDDDIWEKIAYYGIALVPESSYAVFTIGIDEHDELANVSSEKQANLIEIYQIELIKRVAGSYRGLTVQNVKTDRQELCFIVSLARDADGEALLGRFLEDIRTSIRTSMSCTTTIGVGSVYEDVADIHASYDEARTAYGYKIFLGSNRVISIDDAPGDQEWYYIYPFKVEKCLLQHLREGDVTALLESLEDYLESIMVHRLDLFKLKLVNIHLLDNVITCCLEMGYNIGDAVSPERDLYKELLERNDIASMHLWFKRLLVEVVGYMNTRKDARSNEFVERVAQYIDDNFMLPDICMNSICDHFHFSHSFISKVFREVTGKTIKQYITERRFERAMELIEDSNMKIKEIGSSIGYTNTQSFLKIFKRYHGETPREYRSRIVSETDR